MKCIQSSKDLQSKLLLALLQMLLAGSMLALLTACSLSSKKSSEVTISIPDRQWWASATGSQDIPTKNLAIVHERMSSIAPIRYRLAFSKQEDINAFATKQDGRTLVVFTQGFLKEFGNDPDVLATTLGHELAHHQLGHTNSNRKKDQQLTQEVLSHSLGTIANFFIPFGGVLIGPAIQVGSLSFSRDDERDADIQGLEWALQAGYSPCGSFRFANRMADLGKGSALTFLSTHPGNLERAENAQLFMSEKKLPTCVSTNSTNLQQNANE